MSKTATPTPTTTFTLRLRTFSGRLTVVRRRRPETVLAAWTDGMLRAGVEQMRLDVGGQTVATYRSPLDRARVMETLRGPDWRGWDVGSLSIPMRLYTHDDAVLAAVERNSRTEDDLLLGYRRARTGERRLR